MKTPSSALSGITDYDFKRNLEVSKFTVQIIIDWHISLWFTIILSSKSSPSGFSELNSVVASWVNLVMLAQMSTKQCASSFSWFLKLFWLHRSCFRSWGWKICSFWYFSVTFRNVPGFFASEIYICYSRRILVKKVKSFSSLVNNCNLT